MKRLILWALILLVLPALALDVMHHRGWVSERPAWTLLGLAAAFGVILGRWMRDHPKVDDRW